MEKLTIETKKAIIKEFGGDEANTGSTGHKLPFLLTASSMANMLSGTARF